MSTFEKYYQTDREAIELVESKVTTIPPKFYDAALDEGSRKISFTLKPDGIVETTDEST